MWTKCLNSQRVDGGCDKATILYSIATGLVAAFGPQNRMEMFGGLVWGADLARPLHNIDLRRTTKILFFSSITEKTMPSESVVSTTFARKKDETKLLRCLTRKIVS